MSDAGWREAGVRCRVSGVGWREAGVGNPVFGSDVNTESEKSCSRLEFGA